MDTLCKKLLWLALVLVISTSVTAQEKVSKKISKTYALSNSGELHLENKYGDININGWDKNEVSIEIAITVNHRKKENAEDLLKRISSIVHESDDFVSLKYQIADKNSGWFARFIDETSPFDFDKSNLQIDYTVYMPKKAELNVTNTFGDVLIEDWAGKLKGLIEHGDVWISENLNKADITMRYGKLRAKNISYGSLDLRNGSLDMENSTSLRINSSGMDIVLDTINSLELYSNKDEINVEQVGTIYGSLRFTTVELNLVKTSVDLTMKIADFRVSGILEPNASIAIEQVSSEISLNITDFSHRFDATLEQGLVRLPKTYHDIDSQILDKSKKLREIKASYGKALNGKISVTGKKGVVLLKEL